MAPSSSTVPKGKLKAAAVHAAPVYMDKKATTAKVVGLIEDAGKQGIRLLVFPETFIPGYPYFCEAYPPLKQVTALAKYAEQSIVCDASDASMRLIQAACRASRVTISLGVSERMGGAAGYTLFNSQVTIDGADGAILGVHRKLQPTYAERFVWAQGGGWSLRVVRPKLGTDMLLPAGAGDGDGSGIVVDGGTSYNLGGLCCWENTLNGARQALIAQGQHVHAGAWPALSPLRGFEAVADAQIEALMKAHALSAQAFVLSAANYVDRGCLDWMRENLGEQDLVSEGGGWSAVIHPFCAFLAGPHTGAEEKLVVAELDFGDLGPVKVWIDGSGHYKRPEILEFRFDQRPLWPDEGVAARISEGAGRGGGAESQRDDGDGEQYQTALDAFNKAWERSRPDRQ